MTDEEIDLAVERGVSGIEGNGLERASSAEWPEVEAEMALVERLGVFAKAAREIVQAVVAGAAPCTVIDGQCHLLGSCEPEWEGPLSPDGHWKHHPDCPVTKARKLLEE